MDIAFGPWQLVLVSEIPEKPGSLFGAEISQTYQLRGIQACPQMKKIIFRQKALCYGCEKQWAIPVQISDQVQPLACELCDVIQHYHASAIVLRRQLDNQGPASFIVFVPGAAS